MNINRDVVKEEFIRNTARLIRAIRINSVSLTIDIKKIPDFIYRSTIMITGEESKLKYLLTFRECVYLQDTLFWLKNDIGWLEDFTLKMIGGEFEFVKKACQNAYREKITRLIDIIRPKMAKLTETVIRINQQFGVWKSMSRNQNFH